MAKEQKHKYEPTLVYTSLIKAVARARRYGIEKYGDSENWRDTPVADFKDAALRHLDAALRDGEEIDEESGIPHLFLAACNISYLIEAQYGQKVSWVIKFKPSSV